MNRRGIQEWRIYDPTAVNNEPVVESSAGAVVDSTRHPQESVERYTAPDVDPTLRDREPRIEQPRPDIKIVDRRGETRL